MERTGPEEQGQPSALQRPRHPRRRAAELFPRSPQASAGVTGHCVWQWDSVSWRGDTEGLSSDGKRGMRCLSAFLCGVRAPCWPTSLLPPSSFSSLPAQPLCWLSPLPGSVAGMDEGWLLSSDPKVRWELGGWWGRAATPHPLPQPPLLWLRSSQHFLSW